MAGFWENEAVLVPVGVDEDVLRAFVYRVGLPVLEFVREVEGKGGTESPALSNFATRSLKDVFRVVKLGVDFVAAVFPYCNGDRIRDSPNCDVPREFSDPMVASAKGSL